MNSSEGRLTSLSSSDYDDYEDLKPPDSEDEIDHNESREGPPYIPFAHIHAPSLGFEDLRLTMLIPNRPIRLKIIDAFRVPGSSIMNPNLYVIHLQHGNFEWIIKKRYKHFQRLHQQLLLFRASLSLPIPTRRYRERRKSFKHRKTLPLFPRRPEALIQPDQLSHRAEQLEKYLRNLLRIPLYKTHYETMNFLEIGPLSFINDLGQKGKEGLVLKRSGGHLTKAVCLKLRRAITECCGFWRKRWLVVKDSFVAYIRPKDGKIKSVLLMDSYFNVECGLAATGIHHGLLITNLSRQLLVKCWTKRKAREWMQHIVETSNTLARDFTQPNRFDSFAPVRFCVDCRWFIDGGTYFEAIADAVERAKVEIFIADWWLSPEIYLKRPVIQGELWRLDRVLQRKAEEGVKIFVLLYKEVELALGINSYYSKKQLAQLHPNIKVLRHPDHVTGGVLLWAHHEKIVVIDQTYAFLGGIDLCYGRWDDYLHRLTDLGGIHKPVQNKSGYTPPPRRCCSTSDLTMAAHDSEKFMYQAKEMHYNKLHRHDSAESLPNFDITITAPRIEIDEDIKNVTFGDNFNAQEDDKYKKKEKDVPDGSAISRPRFTTKLKTQRVMQAVARFHALKHRLHHKGHSVDSLRMGARTDSLGIPSFELRRTASEVALNQMGLQGSCKLWFGKDYSNFITKDFVNLDRPYQDLVDRTVTPRMPWHDIGVLVQGSAARDVARHFIQRWNFTKLEKAKNYDAYPYLLPKNYENVANIPPLPLSSVGTLYTTNCQILRSVSTWSAGIRTTERSIHSAYVDLINNAKHFIYIENQFFITQAAGHKDVFNEIGEALYRRIMKAHKNNETFRVYVVMPLLPAFEGEIGTTTGTAIQAITHWNYASICRGPGSLIERLSTEIDDPISYISFYGLRNYSTLNDKLVTELVYVHSKLMIVDDQAVIIGSANINDRSLLGKRDSEIAVVIEDIEFEKSLMNEKPYNSGLFAGSLRRSLFKEHLTSLNKDKSLDVDVRDPISEYFFKDVWMKTAGVNTSIFEKVFRCIPADEIHTYSHLRQYVSQSGLCETDPDSAKELLDKVKGYLVLFPLYFLCSENLTPAAGTKEAFMPVSLWT
ncbi:phospholipase D1 isoform X2 [Centruroides vittatus]|uniref:phospholipase D1 isoform X2 n=1 Tax=Centruroides vittatus TaxID=120091 RepID=UPI00350FF6ED